MNEREPASRKDPKNSLCGKRIFCLPLPTMAVVFVLTEASEEHEANT